MKLALSHPGASMLHAAAKDLRTAADALKAKSVEEQAQGLMKARDVREALRPLLANKNFPTKVKGGAALSDAALVLGRVVGRNSKSAISGCSSGGSNKEDGGIVPLLDAELPAETDDANGAAAGDTDDTADDTDDVASPQLSHLPKMLTCVASRLQKLQNEIVVSKSYADGLHVWTAPNLVAQGFLLELAVTRAEQAAAGWPSADKVGFNQATRVLLQRVEEVRVILQGCEELGSDDERSQCRLDEFALVSTCRFSDANCVSPPKPAAAAAQAKKVVTPTGDCATREDLTGPQVATPEYTRADGELSKGRRVRATFPARGRGPNRVPAEVVMYKITDIASDSAEGDPWLNVRGPSAASNYGFPLSQLKAGKGKKYRETLELISLLDMVKNDAEHGLDGLPVPVLKAELKARGFSLQSTVEVGKAARADELRSRLSKCLLQATTATTESIAAARRAAEEAADAAKVAAEQAAAAAKAAADAARAALPSPAAWFAKNSAARKAWGRSDGFDGMKHRSLVTGEYRLDVLHAVELRFIGALFSRLLRLAQVIDQADKDEGKAPQHVFATVRNILESIIGIRLTNARGAWHIRQLHGKQVLELILHLKTRNFANAYPQPQRDAIYDLLEVWPFYVEAISHALYPSRAYGATCAQLSNDIATTARILQVGMSSIFPSTLKDADDTTKGYYGAFTPPSNYAAVFQVPRIFDIECERAGTAAVSAAIFELGHIPMRRIYWATTTRGTQFGGRSVYVELLQNVALQKIGIWSNFGDAKLFPNVRRTRMRHFKIQSQYRTNRERAQASHRRWLDCARDASCTYHSIAADGSDSATGFHRDVAKNQWLRAKHVGLEHDDNGHDNEKDDDLAVNTGEGVACDDDADGGIDPNTVVERQYDDLGMSDAEELRQLTRANTSPVCGVRAEGLTGDEYADGMQELDKENVQDDDDDNAETGSNVPADGEPVFTGNVPGEDE